MKFNKAVTALLVSGALGVAASNASASIYAHSLLEVQDLTVFFTDDGFVSPGGAAVQGFNFASTNTANLNGAADIEIDGCSGFPSTCGPSGAVMDAAVVNAPGSAPLQAENSFTLQGAGASEYSWADSVATEAQLVTAAPTDIQLGTESELQLGTAAGATANLQSTTTFDMEFTVAGANGLSLDFTADPTMLASISGVCALCTNGTAQANMGVTITLRNDDDNSFVIFRPNGDIANSCGVLDLVASGIACTETADAEDLNNTVGTGTDPSADPHSLAAGFGAYGIVVTGLYDGNWTLLLVSDVSTSLSQTRIPEPGTLFLLGAGLLGFAARRKARS